MKPGISIRRPVTALLLSVGLFLVLAVSMAAQVQTETTTTAGAATKQVSVARGEVVYASGHHLIIKMEDGTIRDVTVPDSARAVVDGREIGIHDVKVGMKLEKTVTTTTTPKLITKVETVTGTVFHVTPPISVILTMPNNQNQQFKIPDGQKFSVDGQMVDAFGLKKGMKVSATRVTEVPETHVAVNQMVTGKMPPPPPPPPDVPILLAEEQPTPAPEPAEAAAPAPPAPEPAAPEAAAPSAAPQPAAPEAAAPEAAAPAAPQPAPPETKMSPMLWVGLIALVVVIIVIVVVARKKRATQ
jgi:hypothetical protein